MIFANGDVKEGLFEGGAYKVEGTEEEIRSMLQKNSSNHSTG
jgi:hypothetical protein